MLAIHNIRLVKYKNLTNFARRIEPNGETMNLDSKYLNILESVSFQPIFILGFHRSGTSILYEMLIETDCFNPVTTYHVINYDQLLYNHINKEEEKVKHALNKFFEEGRQIDRGIDRLKISADFPEEYRFIFTKKSHRPKITPENLPLFIEICKKIQFISDKGKPLLLKNPWDFPNFMFIKKAFPEAKFIFIHRNPIDVMNSNIKSIYDLFKKKNLYTALLSKDYEKVADSVLLLHLYRFFLFLKTPRMCKAEARRMVKITDYYLTNINFLNQEDYISIRYEDLCKKPEEMIPKIMSFLGIKTKSEIKYSDFIKTRKTTLLDRVKQQRPYIGKNMHKYLTYCGYNIGDVG